MYHTLKIQISKNNPLYEYCNKICSLANNLYNVGLFYCRQVLTATHKDRKQRTDNERRVMEEVVRTFGKELKSLSYKKLDRILRDTMNVDFFAEGLPRQSAQQTLKNVAQDMRAFFASVKEYKIDPGKFLGKPKLPHYKKSGGTSTVKLTNQDCVPKQLDDGSWDSKLPLTDLRCPLGSSVEGRLKQVEIKPRYDVFEIIYIFDDGKQAPAPVEKPKRIAAIDFGVANTAAITNNAGIECLVFKGGVMKSNNQWYNKRMAEIQSKQTKGTTNKFKPTEESQSVCLKRENQTVDYIRKVSKCIVLWCVANNIDTLVVGKNNLWKQEVSLGHKTNQEFAEFPIARLITAIKLHCHECGITVVEQEESYTSKASFIDGDYIPVYSADDKTEKVFSGKRIRRGMYRAADGTKINADLNASANILRKAFSDAFTNGVTPDFSNVKVIKHPDLEGRNQN